MKILIVEDNDSKASQIKNICLEFAKDNNIYLAKSLRAAYPALGIGRWSLIILDMTLHASEGHLSASSKESLAGIEILQALNADHDPTPVIVATQHDVFRQENLHFADIEELKAALSKAFPRNFRYVIRVRLGQGEWVEELRSRIKALMAGTDCDK